MISMSVYHPTALINLSNTQAVTTSSVSVYQPTALLSFELFSQPITTTSVLACQPMAQLKPRQMLPFQHSGPSAHCSHHLEQHSVGRHALGAFTPQFSLPSFSESP